MDVSKPITERTEEDIENFNKNYRQAFRKKRRTKKVQTSNTHREKLYNLYIKSLNEKGGISEFIEKVVNYIGEIE